jgi:hypothetical protein
MNIQTRTAAAFRQQHHTTALHIFAEGEVKFSGKNSVPANELCKDLCIVDVNGDQRYDMVPIKRGARFADPCLDIGMKGLRRLAELKGTEVLTQDDGIDLKVKDCGLQRSWALGNERLFEANPRDADTVIRQAIPNADSNLKWAVDVVNNEFLIYRPGDGQSA